ncbi:MAG: four helix bundle protein [Elusimicrobiales bacterium]|nr:four helix bundle protein [Elusimicrobiales bacterium]
MEKIREMRVFIESEEISDRVWKHMAAWEEFARNTLGMELVNSMDSINTCIAESYSHKSHHGRLHYLYMARGALFKSFILLEKAGRRELGEVADFKESLEKLMPQINEYIQSTEHSTE